MKDPHLPQHHHLLSLIHHLLDPLLHLLLGFISLRRLSNLLPTSLPLLSESRDIPSTPSVPLCNIPLSLSEFLRTTSVLLSCILLVEYPGVILELLPDFPLVVFR